MDQIIEKNVIEIILGEQTTSNNIQSTSKFPQASTVDYSSLDAFLDGSLLQEKGNMSKSTKEWRFVINNISKLNCLKNLSVKRLLK